MAIEVELPDGNVVEFPEGTDNATMERALSQYRAAPSADFSGVTSRVLPDHAGALRQQIEGDLANTSFGQKALIGAGQSFDSAFRGAKQLFNDSNLTKVGIASQGLRSIGLGGVADALDSRVGAPLADIHQQQAALQDQRNVADAPLLDTGAGLLGAVGGHVAQAAIPVGEAGALTKAVPFLGRMAASIPVGAVQGAMAPVGSDGGRVQNTAIGAALGPTGELLGAGAGALAKRGRDVAQSAKGEAIQLAERLGIPLHLSQISDSIPLKTAMSMAKYVPFSGAGKAAQKQQAAFNRAVGRTFGAEADSLTDDVVSGARRNLSDKFEDVYNRNSIPLDESRIARLTAVRDASSRRLTEADNKVVNNQLDDILAEVGPDGVLTGQKYQALRTQIMKAEGMDKVGMAVKELRKELDDIAAESVSPEDAAMLGDVRRKWANMRTAQKSLQQVAGAGGDVKPTSLWPLVKNGSTRELRDLAKVGQLVLKDPIPDSGTPGRQLISTLAALGGGSAFGVPTGVAIPAIGGAVVGARLLNNPTVAKIVAQQPISRAAGLLAPYLSASGLLAAPVAASANTRRRKAQDDD